MAVEQSGAEAAAQDDASAGSGEEVQGAESDLDDLKRKFREALERKRGDHASAEGTHDTGKVQGSHGPAVSRRSFRRKSGG
jgi:Family of unknown function (DUF5302)